MGLQADEKRRKAYDGVDVARAVEATKPCTVQCVTWFLRVAACRSDKCAHSRNAAQCADDFQQHGLDAWAQQTRRRHGI